MQKIRHWLHRPLVHRCFMMVFVASTAYLCSMLLAGCGLPTWLSDGPGIIKAILTTITSVVSAIGALDPGLGVPAAVLATITAGFNAALTEVQNIEALVQQYQTTPDETTLQKIEQGIAAVTDDLGTLLAPLGIPAALSSKIQAFITLILGQLEAWGSLIPALKPSIAVAGAKLSITVPMPVSDYKAKVNALLEEKTGDPVIDNAFGSVPRV